jgi:hypothetical protein
VSKDVDRDFAWQLPYTTDVRRIVGSHLPVPASWEQDAKEATDFLLYRVIGREVSTVAVRIRRPDVLTNPKWAYWQWQFTVRLWRKSGAKTEHAKLVEGLGDWFFYGVADRSGAPVVKHWMIINLRAWRAALATPDVLRALQTEDRDNKDGTTGFRSYDIRSFPQEPPILIAASFQWPLPRVERAPDLFDQAASDDLPPIPTPEETEIWALRIAEGRAQ